MLKFFFRKVILLKNVMSSRRGNIFLYKKSIIFFLTIIIKIVIEICNKRIFNIILTIKYYFQIITQTMLNKILNNQT